MPESILLFSMENNLFKNIKILIHVQNQTEHKLKGKKKAKTKKKFFFTPLKINCMSQHSWVRSSDYSLCIAYIIFSSKTFMMQYFSNVIINSSHPSSLQDLSLIQENAVDRFLFVF